MGYGAIALAGIAAMAGIGLALHGCGCDTTAFGLHGTDEVETTILGPYRVDSGSPPSGGFPPCESFADLAPGTTIDWNPDVEPSGEGLDCGGMLKAIHVEAVTLHGAAAPLVDAGGGCSARALLSIAVVDPQTSNPSVYDPVPDGGAVRWVLVRQIERSDVAGVTCPLASTVCADSFVARCKKR